MAKRKKTGFDRYFEQQMQDPAFAEAYQKERKEIDAIDQGVREVIRMLDKAREKQGLTKQALALKVGMKPEAVRRLFTAEGYNPTLATCVRVAKALNIRHFDFEPLASEEHCA
ncbi:MAG: helix-turn-helix transcriptional regulator [Myxococcales bacterium]|nr:MAG: helix-turn-helix transcriptional regulator [Myxococcales bacterium]